MCGWILHSDMWVLTKEANLELNSWSLNQKKSRKNVELEKILENFGIDGEMQSSKNIYNIREMEDL